MDGLEIYSGLGMPWVTQEELDDVSEKKNV